MLRKYEIGVLMNSYIFHGGKVLDVDKGVLVEGVEVQVEGGANCACFLGPNSSSRGYAH